MLTMANLSKEVCDKEYSLYYLALQLFVISKQKALKV